ncbi:MAG: dihydrodipicolinate synthase family protein [Pelagibacterales bacterium MED-G42]|nr:MAG: dihydrodipicolinate synthase family protein [Pelagibacterales bacterium MED-G42]
MSLIKGIYAASLSIINDNLSLNIDKTIKHAENIIDYGCHGVVFFGSTGQSQLISLSEKILLINKLPRSNYKKKFIIGTGSNSLLDTIFLMRNSITLGFNKFLIMPPAYYKYKDDDVINFYSKIINEIKECKIILYNFEKLSGYKFSVECVEKLVTKFPDQIIGVKDSSYNLYEKLKINNFSILPGSESKLLKGLRVGCSGVITATCNVTANLSRKVFDDFHKGKENISTELLNNVRGEFDKYNLISALHTYFSKKEKIYQNVIPPLSLMNKDEKQNFFQNLNNLNFSTNNLLLA